MDNEKTPVSVSEDRLCIQLLDYLFDGGHSVSKPLVRAVAHFAYDYGQAMFEQGKIVSKK